MLYSADQSRGNDPEYASHQVTAIGLHRLRRRRTPQVPHCSPRGAHGIGGALVACACAVLVLSILGGCGQMTHASTSATGTTAPLATAPLATAPLATAP